MSIDDRWKKLAEIHKQLSFFEKNCKFSPYLCGDIVTHADLTVFPTTVFMEFMLPRVFGWPPIFTEKDTQFPRLSKWAMYMKENHPHFRKARSDCYNFWIVKEEQG